MLVKENLEHDTYSALFIGLVNPVKILVTREKWLMLSYSADSHRFILGINAFIYIELII